MADGLLGNTGEKEKVKGNSRAFNLGNYENGGAINRNYWISQQNHFGGEKMATLVFKTLTIV